MQETAETETKLPLTWRISESSAQALLAAHPLLSARLRLEMSRVQLLDYVIARGLEAMKLGESGADDPIDRR